MTFTIAERLALGCLRRLTHGSVADIAVPPVGRPVELPGRGTTYVVDLPGPTPDAPTLLLTHGIATTGPLTWFAVLQDLNAHYRVVTFDQRWHGAGIRSRRFRLRLRPLDMLHNRTRFRLNDRLRHRHGFFQRLSLRLGRRWRCRDGRRRRRR